MLYALWCLGDLERVESLEQQADRVAYGYTMNHAMNAPKYLEQEREAVLRDMRRSVRSEPDRPAKDIIWPGMVGYQPPPGKPTNVLKSPAPKRKGQVS